MPEAHDPRKKVFEEIRNLSTEGLLPEARELDMLSVEEILRLINDQDRRVPEVVRQAIPRIARVVEVYVNTLKQGRRVFYVGSGTSGRLGIVDAAELWPTYGLPWDRVQGLIAGGYGAVFRSQEGAEDREAWAVRDLKERGLTDRDFVIGLAASSRTPYVVGALRYARSLGAPTALIVAVPEEQVRADIRALADHLVALPVGPEVVMGSTRMKAGTAQKLTLNMISTTAMIRLGKVYGNLMVDLYATSEKLQARSIRLITMITDLPFEEARALLDRTGGSVKVALAMHLGGWTLEEARKRLEEAGGFLRKALESEG
ncbi:MAG: N-acetylmuramic acid 6-phosphate etherase [Candidatus Hydrothermae bacterium]|nr:N-acetylmuramic acid 6-phosphate etherase [Candidatus Hydrothermae bacterium]